MPDLHDLEQRVERLEQRVERMPGRIWQDFDRVAYRLALMAAAVFLLTYFLT